MEESEISDLSERIQQELVALKHTLTTQNYLATDDIFLDSKELTSQLARYLLLLEKWNRSHDLVGPGSAKDFIFPHIIDSLAALFVLQSLGHLPKISNLHSSSTTPLIGDIGTGAGLPGIPWQIAYQEQGEIILLEPRAKRVHFLKECKRSLTLNNAHVIEGRIEALLPLLSNLHDRQLTFILRALKPEKKVLGCLNSPRNLNLLWLTGPQSTLDKNIWQEEHWQEIASYSLVATGEHRRKIFCIQSSNPNP